MWVCTHTHRVDLDGVPYGCFSSVQRLSQVLQTNLITSVPGSIATGSGSMATDNGYIHKTCGSISSSLIQDQAMSLQHQLPHDSRPLSLRVYERKCKRDTPHTHSHGTAAQPSHHSYTSWDHVCYLDTRSRYIHVLAAEEVQVA